jgi:site-specific DNA-adenine methylase
MPIAFHGGKQRTGEEIADVVHEISVNIEEDEGFQIKGYCEPFCGMLGVYKHIPELFEGHKPKLRYKAGDANASLIAMWQAAKKGWKPPIRKIKIGEFERLAGNGKVSREKGYIGHLYGYRGKYFQPFEHRTTKAMRIRSSEGVHTIGEDLRTVSFTSGFYTQFSRLRGYVIYCDPPYAVQSYYYDEYGTRRVFDRDAFWEWCRRMSENNIVFVSEYSMPKDFEEVWSKGKERLYVI